MSLRTYVALVCDTPGCGEVGPLRSTSARATDAAAAEGWTVLPHLIQGKTASWRHLCPHHSGEDPA